jgi:thymidine kinase
MCYGLRTDFQTRLFPGSKRLLELADTIEEIKSTCSCGGKAIVNARVDKDGNIVTDGSQVEVGAEDKYITLCRQCYNFRIIKKKIKSKNI